MKGICRKSLLKDQIVFSQSFFKKSIVFEFKGSLQGGGVGKIVVTNKSIMWTKSKGVNFLMGGVISFVTKGDTAVKFKQILKLDTYFFLGGAGLCVYANDGKNYKFGFNSKKDRDKAIEYIRGVIE